MKKRFLSVVLLAALPVVVLPLAWSRLGAARLFEAPPAVPRQSEEEAAAVVQVAYALAAKADLPSAEPDPFQTGDAAGPVIPSTAGEACPCSGRKDCTCAAGRCECPACSDAWTPAAFEAARRGRLPVVVCVGQPAIPAPGWLSYSADDYADTPRPGVIVVRPDDGDLIVVKRLAGRPTPGEIRAVLNPPPPPAPVLNQPVDTVPVQPAWPAVFQGFGFAPVRGGRCRS
jgi:hypothetical protein